MGRDSTIITYSKQNQMSNKSGAICKKGIGGNETHLYEHGAKNTLNNVDLADADRHEIHKAYPSPGIAAIREKK